MIRPFRLDNYPMRSKVKRIESEFDNRETQLLSFTLAGAKDSEISKYLRISESSLEDLWARLYEKRECTSRSDVLRSVYGSSVAEVWKSKQDLETRLHEQIFDHQTEQAILHEITLTTNTGGWSLDLNTGQIVWTQGINAILNRPLDAGPLDPLAVQALVHPDDQPLHRRSVERLLSEGTPFNITYRIVIDGDVKNIRSVTRAHFNDEGKLIRVFGTITDETETLRIRESETASKRMIESIAAVLPETVYVLDVATNETVYSNRNIAASLGYSQLDSQEMGPGIPVALLNPADIVPFADFREGIHALGDRETQEIEIRLRHVTGHWVYFTLSKVVFSRDAAGQVCQTLTTVHDITDLRSSQKALVENEDILERSFQDAPLGMAILSMEGTYEKVNPAYAEISGYSIEELVGESILVVNDTEEVNRYLDYLCDAMTDPHSPPYRTERESIRKDGLRVWVNEVCSILWNGEGRPVRVISQILDLTAARNAAHLQKETDERIKTVVSSLPIGIMLIQQDGLISTVNASAAAILGAPVEDLLNKRVEPSWALFTEEGRRLSLDQHPARHALSGKVFPLTELRLVTQTGHESWVRASCSPLCKPDQPLPYAVVLTFTDISTEVKSRQPEKGLVLDEKLKGKLRVA